MNIFIWLALQTLTPTPDPGWPTPTLFPTPASTTFLDNFAPTAVEFYARSAEWGVQSYNAQATTEIDFYFGAIVILFTFIAFVRFFAYIKAIATTKDK